MRLGNNVTRRKRKSYTPTFSVDPEEQRYLSHVYNKGKPGSDPFPTIKTGVTSPAYRDNYDRVFGKRR